MEAFKSFDREGMGFISLGEMRHMLTVMGIFEFYNLFEFHIVHGQLGLDFHRTY